MNPDYFPWQVGLPIAGFLWGWLAVRWHLDRTRGGGRGARCEEGAQARRGEVRKAAEGAHAAVVRGETGGAGAGDGRRDPRVAGCRWSAVRGDLVATLAGVRS